jgi:molecular chaperone DnaK
VGKIIGIDLGTTNSAAAVMIGTNPTIIQPAEGSTIGGKRFLPLLPLPRKVN